VVSIAAGAAVLAAVVNGHGPVSVLAIGVCAAVLALIGVIDVRTWTVPNRLVYPALALAFIVAAVDPARSLTGSLVAAAFAGGLFAVAFYVRPSAFFGGALTIRPGREISRGEVRWCGAAGAVATLVFALVQPEQSAATALAAAAVAGCPFLLRLGTRESGGRGGAAATTPARGVGGGDVKLAALLGAVTGVPDVLSVLLVAVAGGAVAALTLAFMRRSSGAIPYGPFLAAGTVLALL
jgi:leader peptidase (prepilin peptidase)/N-methyltransferase